MVHSAGKAIALHSGVEGHSHSLAHLLFFLLFIIVFLAQPAISSWHSTPHSGINDPPTIGLEWKADLGNGYIDSKPLFVGGYIYVLTSGLYDWTTGRVISHPRLFKIDPAFGGVRWSLEFNSSVGYELSNPIYFKGYIYVLTADGILHKVSQHGVEVGWLKLPSFPFTTTPMPLNDEMVCVGPNGSVFMVDPYDMTIKYTVDIGHGVYYSSPALYHSLIVFGTDDGRVVALNPGSGAVAWSLYIGGKVRTTPSTSGPFIAVSSFVNGKGNCALIDDAGTIVWLRTLEGKPSSPLYVDGLYLFPCGSRIWVLDYSVLIMGNNTTLRYVEVNGGVGGMTAHAHSVFITTNIDDNGRHSSLYIFNPKDGWLRGAEMVPYQWCLSQPTAFGGWVVCANDAGYVFLYHIIYSTTLPTHPRGYTIFVAIFCVISVLKFGVRRA